MAWSLQEADSFRGDDGFERRWHGSLAQSGHRLVRSTCLLLTQSGH